MSVSDAEQTNTRDRARSISHGKHILAAAAVLLGIYGCFAYTTGSLDWMIIVPLLLLAAVGVIAVLAPDSRVARSNLEQNAAFIDLPGDSVLLWAVPFSLRHHYIGTARPYGRYALFAAVAAGAFVVAIAMGPSAARVSWLVYVALVVGMQAVALASAWAQTGLMVAVSMQHGMLRIRDYGFGVLGFSERSAALAYDQLDCVEFTQLAEPGPDRWLVRLRGKEGRVITLGLDGKDLAAVRGAFEAAAVRTSTVSV